jgi:uncharacterized protein YdeI (YjbR/CyaY-like superfamily)
MGDDLQQLPFADADALDAWLDEHHDSSPGIWMQLARQAAGIPSVTWEQAVPVLLRWGWIDGQRRRLDDAYFLVRCTPRRARSVWSQVNVEHAERLIAEGRMQPAGLAQVDAAKADGRWSAAYGSGSSMQVPPELQAALDASPRAAAEFAQLDRRNWYAMCWRVHTAKRAGTRQRRAAEFVELLERGERLH